MNETIYSLLDTVQKTAVQAGDTASGVAYLAGKKASALLSAAKLNVRIMERKGAVNDALREVGEMVYATHTGTPSDSEALLEKLQSIDTLKAEIASMEIEAGRATVIRTCATCGAEAKAEDVFCRECGEKL